MIEPIVVEYCGSTGSGKTTLRKATEEALERKGISSKVTVRGFTIGDVFRGIVARRGEDPNDRSLLYEESRILTEQVSSWNFPLWLVMNTPSIHWDREGIILVDGGRTPDEARRMQDIFSSMILVYCDCPLEERVRRLQEGRGASSEVVGLSNSQSLEADYSREFLAMEGVIVASPDVPIEETVRRIVARLGRLL